MKHIYRTLYGDAFPLCTDPSLMAMSSGASYSPLLDFIGLEPSVDQQVKVGAITYQSVAGAAAGTGALPWQDDACGDRLGTEWGGCSLAWDGFGRLSLKTFQRDATNVDLKMCSVQPFYDAFGTRIMDEKQWDLLTTAKALTDSLHTALVVGNKASSTAQFDGLQRLIKTGYVDAVTGDACTSMDSIVINYNSNIACPADASPPSGVTWNGQAVSPANLMQLIEAAVGQVIHRIQMSRLGQPVEGNMVMVIPASWIDEVIDCYICSKYCNNNALGLSTPEARDQRDRILQGGFNQGVLRIRGINIPILGYDYGNINNAGTLADIYILTNAISGTPFMRLQYKDMRNAVKYLNAGSYATDNGKILITPANQVGTCSYYIEETQPRLIMRAPWAQIKITNVARSGFAPVISADPLHPFYVEQNLVAHVEV